MFKTMTVFKYEHEILLVLFVANFPSLDRGGNIGLRCNSAYVFPSISVLEPADQVALNSV